MGVHALSAAPCALQWQLVAPSTSLPSGCSGPVAGRAPAPLRARSSTSDRAQLQLRWPAHAHSNEAYRNIEEVRSRVASGRRARRTASTNALRRPPPTSAPRGAPKIALLTSLTARPSAAGLREEQGGRAPAEATRSEGERRAPAQALLPPIAPSSRRRGASRALTERADGGSPAYARVRTLEPSRLPQGEAVLGVDYADGRIWVGA